MLLTWFGSRMSSSWYLACSQSCPRPSSPNHPSNKKDGKLPRAVLKGVKFGRRSPGSGGQSCTPIHSYGKPEQPLKVEDDGEPTRYEIVWGGVQSARLPEPDLISDH